jgi:hypothetical protein
MNDKEIDIEKDHLVIFRNSEGAFSEFQWYNCRKTSRESLEEKISKHNSMEAANRFGRVAELEDGRLVREICAYREHVSAYETVVQNARDIQQTADEAIDILDGLKSNLDWALESLWKIKRLNQ